MMLRMYFCFNCQLLLVALINLVGSFHHFHRFSSHRPVHSLLPTQQTKQSEASSQAEDIATSRKTLALYYLDCLTSPKDPEHPEYDNEKHRIRQRLINENSYTELRTHCRRREMSSGSEKLDMLIRLYAYEIDSSVIVPDIDDDLEPTVNNYPNIDPVTGDIIKEEENEPETEVRFVNDEDIMLGEVTIQHPDETAANNKDDAPAFRTPPDCDDLRLLESAYRRSRDSKRAIKPVVIPDGMLRAEVSIPRLSLQYPLPAPSTASKAKKRDIPDIAGYLTVSQALVRRWQDMAQSTGLGLLKAGYTALRPEALVIIIPSDINASIKAKHVLADEIAAMSNAAVLLIELRATTKSKAIKDEILSAIAYLQQPSSNDIDGEPRQFAVIDMQGLKLPPNALPPIDRVALLTYGSAAGIVSSLAGDLQAICFQHAVEVLQSEGLDTIIDTATTTAKDGDSDENWQIMTKQRKVLTSLQVFGEVEPRILTARGQAERYGTPWPSTADTVDTDNNDEDNEDEEEQAELEPEVFDRVLQDPVRSAKVDALLTSSLDEMLAGQQATTQAAQEATGQGDLLRLALEEGKSLEFERSLDPLGLLDEDDDDEADSGKQEDPELAEQRLTQEILRNRQSFSLHQQLATMKRLAVSAKGLIDPESPLTMTQAVKMRPSSLILINPDYDSIKKELTRLTLPTLLLYSGGEKGEVEAKESHLMLSQSPYHQQMTDYLCRLYPSDNTTTTNDTQRWALDLPLPNEGDEEDEPDSEWWIPKTDRFPLTLMSRVRLDMIDTIGKWIPFIAPRIPLESDNDSSKRRRKKADSQQLPDWLLKELPAELLEQQQQAKQAKASAHIRPKAEPMRWKRLQRTVQRVKVRELQKLPAGLVNRYLHDPLEQQQERTSNRRSSSSSSSSSRSS